ncbi:hypothetical protein [Methylomicrobium lacus]|uniref:hypothetical protein n=1 Tax=Methylomicrobium lacus TaxID=136992 RepID=UPI00045E7971|nr:hypothetical protein [Methylomicrobium lacus]
MFIDGITEGKIVAAAGGAHKRHLRIRLNEISMIFLEALRTDGGIGEFIRKFIHDNPSAENQRLDKKFDWDERRTGQLKK